MKTELFDTEKKKPLYLSTLDKYRGFFFSVSKSSVFICKTETSIFIYPWYKWRFIDNLITNFHLPKSTLMMLVSALAWKENIKKAYSYAISQKYRFFSFWDAMMINWWND